MACGLCCAWCDAATLTQASWALVVPNWCMWRMAAMAYMLTVVGAYGNSNGPLGHGGDGRARHGAGGHALRAGPPRQRDQRHRALAQRDRLGGVADVEHVGRAAGVRGVHVPELEAQVVGHRQRAEPGRVARAEVAVDVVLGEPGVRERAVRDLGVELGDRLVVRLARRVLERADDVGLALDGQRQGCAASTDVRIAVSLMREAAFQWRSYSTRAPNCAGPGGSLAPIVRAAAGWLKPTGPVGA